MARTEARIKCDIWDDEDFRSLTWEAQWLYHAILEQKDLSLCGVLTWTPKRFAKLAKNANASSTKRALDLLRERRYVLVDEETDELWVRTLIKNDRVLDNHNSIVGMSNAFGAIHSKVIRDALVKGVLEGVGKGVLDALPKGVRDRLSKPFTHALALAGAGAPPRPPVPPASCLPSPASLVGSVPSSSKPQSRAAPTSDDDDGEPERTTLDLLVERRIALTERSTHQINNPIAYRAKVVASVEAEIGYRARDLLAKGLSPGEVVDELLPLPSRNSSAGATPEPDPYAAIEPLEYTELEDGTVMIGRAAS